MAVFKSYEYRIYPNADQIKKITDVLDEQDRAFNKLIDLVNMRFCYGSSADTIVSEVASMLPGAVYDKYLQKDIEALVARLERGEINEILPHAKYRRHRSFEFSPVSLNGQCVFVPNVGWVETVFHRTLPKDSHVFSAVVTEDEYGSVYKVTFRLVFDAYEIPSCEVRSEKVVGLDYKQDGLYIDSNGQSGEYPGFWLHGREKVSSLYETANRFCVGSRRWLKFQKRAAKLATHIFRQRKDWQYKKANELAKENDAVCIESLDMSEMQESDYSLTPKIRDNNWIGFRKKLGEKLAEEGKPLIEVPKYFPSSQICSVCGYRIGKQALNIRYIACPYCGTMLDRDINAACNIRDEGLRMLQAS